MKQESIKKSFNVLVIILLAGIICHGLGLIIADSLFPRESLSMALDPGKIHLRIDVLNFAYGGCTACSAVFFLGLLHLLWRCNRNNQVPNPKNLGICCLRVITVLFACTGIFVLIDWNNWQNYLFPLWSILGTLGLFLILSFALGLAKRK